MKTEANKKQGLRTPRTSDKEDVNNNKKKNQRFGLKDGASKLDHPAT